MGGPAERAGIRVGDVVVAVDGAPVATVDALMRLLSRVGPGATVKVSVVRGGQRLELPATLAASAS